MSPRWLFVWPRRATLHLGSLSSSESCMFDMRQRGRLNPAVVDIKRSTTLHRHGLYLRSRLVVTSTAWRCVHFQNLHYISLESITPFFFEHAVSDFSAKAVVYLMFVNSVDLLHTRSVLSPTVKILSSEGKKHSLQAPRKKKKKKAKKIPHSTRLSAEETLTSIFVGQK